MSRKILSLAAATFVLAAGSAYAQENGAASGPAIVEITYLPVSAAIVASKDGAPSFGNLGLGSAITYNLNRHVGFEGEIGATLATTSDLQFGDLNSKTKAPNLLTYTGNVVVSPWTGYPVVPYVTGGIGALTLFERPGVGVTSDETFLIGSVGGGVKWYAPSNKWGVRGDYRFVANRSKDEAPAFFGRDTRYVHRVYAGVIINAVR